MVAIKDVTLDLEWKTLDAAEHQFTGTCVEFFTEMGKSFNTMVDTLSFEVYVGMKHEAIFRLAEDDVAEEMREESERLINLGSKNADLSNLRRIMYDRNIDVDKDELNTLLNTMVQTYAAFYAEAKTLIDRYRNVETFDETTLPTYH